MESFPEAGPRPSALKDQPVADSWEDDPSQSGGSPPDTTGKDLHPAPSPSRQCTKILPASSSAPKFKFVVPNEFVSKFMQHLVEQPFKMVDGQGGSWDMTLIQRRNKEKYEYMLQGWRRFGEEMGVQEGDTVVFEMVNSQNMLLNIVQRSTGGKGGKLLRGKHPMGLLMSEHGHPPPMGLNPDLVALMHQHQQGLGPGSYGVRSAGGGGVPPHPSGGLAGQVVGGLASPGAGALGGYGEAALSPGSLGGPGGHPGGLGLGPPGGLGSLPPGGHGGHGAHAHAHRLPPGNEGYAYSDGGMEPSMQGGDHGGPDYGVGPRYDKRARTGEGPLGGGGGPGGGGLGNGGSGLGGHGGSSLGPGSLGGPAGGGGGPPGSGIGLLSEVADLDLLTHENMRLREELCVSENKVHMLESGVLNIKSVLTKSTDPGLISMTGVMNLLTQMESSDLLPELTPHGRMALQGVCNEIRRHLNGVLRMVWILRSLPEDVQRQNSGALLGGGGVGGLDNGGQ